MDFTAHTFLHPFAPFLRTFTLKVNFKWHTQYFNTLPQITEAREREKKSHMDIFRSKFIFYLNKEKSCS